KEGVVEAAGREEAAAEVAEEAEPVLLVEPGLRETNRRLPAECAPGVLAAPDVEGAIDDDVELEAGAGPELEQPDAAFGAVPERHEPDAGSLVEPSDASHQCGSGELLVEQSHRPLRSISLPKHAGAEA